MSESSDNQENQKLYRVSNLSPQERIELTDKFSNSCRDYCAHDHAGIFQMTDKESVEFQAAHPEARVQILTR